MLSPDANLSYAKSKLNIPPITGSAFAPSFSSICPLPAPPNFFRTLEILSNPGIFWSALYNESPILFAFSIIGSRNGLSGSKIFWITSCFALSANDPSLLWNDFIPASNLPFNLFATAVTLSYCFRANSDAFLY